MERKDLDLAELEFERELIDSATSDGCPEGATEAAWARFAAAVGGAATLVTAERASGLAGSKLVRSGRAPFAWLALGAFGGAAIVAVLPNVFALHGAEPTPSPAAPANSTSVSPPGQRTPPLKPQSSADRDAATAPPAPAVALRPSAGHSKQAPRAGRSASTNSTPIPAGGALAAEIALLDEVRRAITARELDRALLLLSRYRREHPRGELRRESDVLAMETFAARGEHSEAARLARIFLDAYPSDPQVARVRIFDSR
jgi:hypothetical protein